MLTKEYSAKSLFEATDTELSGYQVLLRYADVECERLVPFYARDYDPKIFDNRERFYLNNNYKLPEGTVGVIDWRVEPNSKDDSKDWQTVRLNYDLTPTIVIYCGEGDTKTLANRLQEGISYTGELLGPVIFVNNDLERKGRGIYFPKESLLQNDNKLTPDPKMLTAEIVDISDDHINYTQTKRFLDNLSKPQVVDHIVLKDDTVIVRDIILQRATNKDYLRSIGYSQNDRRKFREFLSKIPRKTIAEQVKDACKCSEKNAEILVDNCIIQANDIFSKDDLDQSLMERLIENNSALTEEMRKAVALNWEKENEERQKKAEDQIQQLVRKKESVNDEIERAKKVLDEINHEIEQKQSELAELEKRARMGDEITEKVQQKITTARQDVTDFLAQMIVLQAPLPNATNQGQNIESKHLPASTSDISLTDHEESLFIKRTYGLSKEKCSDWTEVLEILGDNLENAGAAVGLSTVLAKILYAISSEGQNVLLIGPNAEACANATSAALSGKPCDVLYCCGEYQRKYVLKAKSEAGKTILIENLFSSRWIDNIGDIVNSLRGHLLIFTAPFAEDLSIEPAGLLNYMVPIFTELYLEGTPGNDFYYVDWSKKIRELNVNKQALTYDGLLNQLGVGRYAIIILERIIGKIKEMEHGGGYYDVYTFLLPIAQFKGNKSILENHIKNSEKIPDDQKKKILAQIGD